MNKTHRKKQTNIGACEQTSFENCLNQDFGPWCQSLAVLVYLLFISCVNTVCYLVLCSVKAVNGSLHLCIWKVSLLEFFLYFSLFFL